MYKTIVLDCQAEVVDFSCEDCIAFKKCTIDKKTNRKPVDKAKADGIEFFVCHI